jgi:death-on-curing protein
VTTHLSLELLLRIAGAALGSAQEVLVRDHGLLESAVARPATTVYGEDAYPSLELKAAALLHSLTTNHALVDGNTRLAWAATVVFAYVNGQYLDAPDDEAFALVMGVAAGTVADLVTVADRLHDWSRPV